MMMVLVEVLAALCGACACVLLVSECFALRQRRVHTTQMLGRLKVLPEDSGFAASMNAAPLATQDLQHAWLYALPFVGPALKRRQQQALHAAYCLELPKLFEIVALGMRVGLGFDQAFALYARGFDTELAHSCRARFEVWERGLITREAGLKELSKHIACKEFERFVAMSLRALDYGAPLMQVLYELAKDARKSYRAARQEMVAKAPVKMLIPTGMLILPAMMMMVLGPMVLDITERLV
jgi:tight adherence protein C